jgi:uncharacterized iron-regulated membrane protein
MSDSNNFLLERYKYILARKQALNEATFKIAAIYQAVLLALGLAQFNVIAMLNAKSISLEIAKFASLSIQIMLVTLTVLILSLLVGGILSWLKYRKDEGNIDLAIMGVSRMPVKLSSALRWYETYIAITILVVCILSIWGYNYSLPILMGTISG